MNTATSFIGYGLASSAFLVLAIIVTTTWRSQTRKSFLLPMALAMAASMAFLAWLSRGQTANVLLIALLEFVADFALLLFLASLMSGAVIVRQNWVVRYGGVLLAASLLVLIVVFAVSAGSISLLSQLLVFGSIGTSLFGLVSIEQIYRNSRPVQQNALKFLCLGVGSIFAYDLLMYSNAVIEGGLGNIFWEARGFVVALCVPLISVSIRRNDAWGKGIFVSRQVVFYSTTLVAAGLYLTVIGLAGYVVQLIAPDRGATLQIIVLSAGAIAFVVFLLSDQLRARVRVFFSKHFFERKYDYRDEWLRLIGTLTESDEGMPLQKRAIQAVAQILQAETGRLFQKSADGQEFVETSSWNIPGTDRAIPGREVLPEFLQRTGWVINVSELRGQPGKYEGLSAEEIDKAVTDAGFLVPLVHDGDLVGFISVAEPRVPVYLNYEDYDLLKTVGQQVASYLVLEHAGEQLTESRQFEAFNRFTAYVMHDLKNAIAQQSLVVSNAEKHKRNPDFVDDAIRTIDSSVSRMKKVMAQLQQRSSTERTERVDVSRLLYEVESQCADRQPEPVVVGAGDPVYVLADRDRLFMAISHAIRNAQDATPNDGRIELSITARDGECVIDIKDSGKGMSQSFIRDRLYKPFDSTKGAEGMGIGAYQVRETVHAAGGEVYVISEEGVGTEFFFHLPLAPGAPS